MVPIGGLDRSDLKHALVHIREGVPKSCLGNSSKLEFKSGPQVMSHRVMSVVLHTKLAKIGWYNSTNMSPIDF